MSDRQEALQDLIDAVGDITMICCEEKCDYHGSADQAKDRSARCRECHVREMSDTAFAAAHSLGVHWSPMKYEIRRHGAMWPNWIMPDEGEAEE